MFPENSFVMMLWIGLNVNPDWIQDVFAVHSAAQIDIDMVSDVTLPTSKCLSHLSQNRTVHRHNCLTVCVVCVMFVCRRICRTWTTICRVGCAASCDEYVSNGRSILR